MGIYRWERGFDQHRVTSAFMHLNGFQGSMQNQAQVFVRLKKCLFLSVWDDAGERRECVEAANNNNTTAARVFEEESE
ncbi:hypothetical protein TSUD_119510 [Trifolium subterraneum]|uniref:Uncharacterized protein n=1 Tax=Trifolium subterraneum TaxID=3900 RepID=A0A2Z6NNT0_TRISU|nr:hypothetical protein TSUD_119510 [Trifolium subterraneum]